MSELRKAALHYASLGWRVFPCKPGGKEPLTAHGVKDATTSTAQIINWWAQWPDANIGFACGGDCKVHVVDVDVDLEKDIDGWKAMNELRDAGNVFLETACQNTPRGGAHFFYHSDVKPKNKNSFMRGVDIRSEGYYVLLPPSIHPNGGMYKWAPKLAPWQCELAEYPDFMRPPERKQDPCPASPQSTSTPVAQASDDIIMRAKGYLATCDPAVQGQAGHDKLLWAASAMVNGLMLSDDEAFTVLSQYYNPLCSPPWDLNDPKDLKDFSRKITEARKNPPRDKAIGWLLDDPAYPAAEQEILPGLQESIDKMIAAHKAKAKDTAQSPANDKKYEARTGTQKNDLIQYRRITCAELDASDYKLEYLIEHTLVAGQPCIVAGGKKCLKTSLILDMAIALGKGGFFLGNFKVNRACKVAVMTGESGLATVQETCRRICDAAGYKLADIQNLIFSEDLPRFGKVTHEDALRQWLIDNNIEVLVLDPAYLCLPGADAGNLFAQGELLRGMAKVCSDCGCTMILCHHTRKSQAEPFSPPELEDIAWAGFQEFARQWILLGRRELYKPGTGKHRLWLSVGGSAGHTSLWALNIEEGSLERDGERYWHVDVMRTDDARQEVLGRREAAKEKKRQEQFEQDKRTICDTLVKFPKGETKSVIRDSARLGTRRFTPAFAELISGGDIHPCKITKSSRKTPYEGYKLVEGTHP